MDNYCSNWELNFKHNLFLLGKLYDVNNILIMLNQVQKLIKPIEIDKKNLLKLDRKIKQQLDENKRNKQQ